MDSEHDESAQGANDMPVADAGAQLRAAREELRLDLPHIAAETRIPLRHLEAIESGNFDALPSRAYAIGFSRSFAKAVGLDPAAITDVVRAELAVGSMRRTTSASVREPGDPARVPSAGLAWAGAVAALVLMVGAYAFYSAYFGAGSQPGPLITTAPSPTPVVQPNPATTVPVTDGKVVLTALQDGVWLRLYEQGGERLVERTLQQGETVTVPAAAADPRINTGRPDALAITVGGKAVAKLADRATTISGTPVSAAALLGRAAPATDVAMAVNTPASATVSPPASRSVVRDSVPLTAPRETASAGPIPSGTATASDIAESMGN